MRAMKELFSNIAGRYDRMNRLMSLSLDIRWRRMTLNCVSMPPSGPVLDLACGTGDFAAEVLRRRPDAEITGLDLSPAMLDLARTKLGDRRNVNLVSGDAQDLSRFAPGSFALIVCGFGFRNFPDRPRALAECHRVLKPGGELAVLELFRPASRIVGACVNVWLRTVAAVFARDAADEYAYLRRSIANTVSADEFEELAKRVGFAVTRRRNLFPAATCITLSAV